MQSDHLIVAWSIIVVIATLSAIALYDGHCDSIGAKMVRVGISYVCEAR
jgi:hypothetical protein